MPTQVMLRLGDHRERRLPRFPTEEKNHRDSVLEPTGAPHAGKATLSGAVAQEMGVTHLLGFLGLMLNGGPGGPSFLGKMSTHICTFP